MLIVLKPQPRDPKKESLGFEFRIINIKIYYT